MTSAVPRQGPGVGAMGKKSERAAKERAAAIALEEEAKSAARHSDEEYQCTGLLEQDFPELCARAGLTYIPRVTVRPRAVSLPEEPEATEGQASATHIQSKYAYFRPRIQTELELDDPKSVREVFMRGWKIEDKMLGIFSKCLPALGNLQALHLWKVGLTDLLLSSLVSILPSCPNLKTLSLEGNPLPEGSFYKLIPEDSTLAHLSLRNNSIDDAAAWQLGQALSTLTAANRSLVSLTLSFNHIGDVGADHIAQGLRLNRSLLSLSLAHNRIGDEGAARLAEVLGPFALTHTEVVERRRLLLEKESQERSRVVRMLPGPWCQQVVWACPMGRRVGGSPALHPETFSSLLEATRGQSRPPLQPGQQHDHRQAAAHQAGQEHGQEETLTTPEQKIMRGKGAKSGNKEKRNQPLEPEVPELTEIMNPLLEQAEHREGKVFLPGNHVLINLNLTRNQITEQGLRAFLAAVESQQQQWSKAGAGAKGQTGLLRLSLGKNHFPAESETFARIQELMLPRDPLAKQGPKDEEQSVPT
ncbi:leucine-rich repeat-containing protein 71 isoform X3 [Alligator sinensis]|uniref:Leucine-rich repeat-containing protein 71 isoform X3 n=1 Tax=Alligator sinensis TaxID=38654 RepID=A0A3Q0HDU2_ALLSI|nr:leucine-rich repeat-containing protein 71 isoform X3 [Alligator sinensis]